MCFHQNIDVALHDIIIEYDQNTYIPPNKHIGKSETLCILQGEIEIYFFTDNGECFKVIKLSAENINIPFLVRVPPNTWHGINVVSDLPCIIKETISGPYDHNSLQWATFAPSV